MFLCYWMRESGLADLLPTLRNTVYVGLSAGSMVMTPNNETAIKVTDGNVEVVSEGHWKLFNP